MQQKVEKNDIWLIGAGLMAKEYAKVLNAQGIKFSVIGRGETSAKIFQDEFNVPVFIGGLELALESTEDVPKYVVVASNIEVLMENCLALLEFGVKDIFVEKPAGLDSEEVKKICDKANETNANVYVAYNRRYFASTLKAKEIIKEDGGVASFNFEFTEWSHILEKLNKPKRVMEGMLIANSSHVLDLAFYLCGEPKKMNCYSTGGLDWYTKASNFAGAGITHNEALFSYKANWKGPGRWGVEAITNNFRLILCPLEKLKIQKIGSVAIEEVEIDDELDQKFKPGLFLQTQIFLNGNREELLNINKHYERMLIFEHIENGTDLI